MSKLAVTTGIVGLWLSSFTILSAQTLSITEYATSGAAGAIVTGPDGALWFTEGAKIGRITTAGSLTDYPIPPDSSGSILSITAGPDGALWYVETFNNTIARITTAGVVTEYAVPTSDTNPWGIASGPDGALWFTEQYGTNIGRITTAGVITEYPIPTFNAQPGGIVAGPDGASGLRKQLAIRSAGLRHRASLRNTRFQPRPANPPPSPQVLMARCGSSNR